MAIRTLDPVFWDDESVALLSRDARLLFICMVTDPSLTDDFGVLPANARTLRKHAFAFDDDVTPEQVEGWRDEMLTKCQNVMLFEVAGKPWLWLRHFQKFQNLRYHRKTTYPNPPDISEHFGKLPELCDNFPMGGVVLSSGEKRSVEEGGSARAQNTPPHLDPVEHMLTARADMHPGIADPNEDPAAWMQYRDDALKAYQSATNVNPIPANRDLIVLLAGETGFVPARWESSVSTCLRGGVNPKNVGCMVDTYRDGGDYRQMLDKRRGNGGHPPAPPGTDQVARDRQIKADIAAGRMRIVTEQVGQ